MKQKTITKIISAKINAWIETIDDQKVKELVQKNTIVTGGCIASMMLNEKVNDFDIYFTNLMTVEAVAKYYVKKFGDEDITVVLENPKKPGELFDADIARVKILILSDGVVGETPEEIEESEEPTEHIKDDMQYRPVFMSANAISLSGRIQIVVRFYGNPESIHQHYDYVHCTNYWLSSDGKLYLNQPALESLLTKELIYVGSQYPICSIIRTRKFIRRGWTINAGQYLKMAYQVSKLDLDDIDVLEDQLTGVDSVYFMMLIEALKQKPIESKLNYGYICTIIDKIF